MKRDLIEIAKRRIKTALKDAYYLPFDAIDHLMGKRDTFTPPRRLIFVGDGDFRKTGDEFFKYFVELGGLKPEHTVLDVGCGIGRMAIPLTTYLTKGRYEGFDIVRRGITWSTENISVRYPNFRFQLADVYNRWYNPGGAYDASDYKFPFADESFDFVFLTSVFTHMLPPDFENYLSEVARVMRKGSKALFTFFLLNDESRSLVSQGRSHLAFMVEGEGYVTISEAKPESAVAYEEARVAEMLAQSRLDILHPIYYGSWCGRSKYLSYQDILIVIKR